MTLPPISLSSPCLVKEILAALLAFCLRALNPSALFRENDNPGCKKQVFDQQFSEKLVSADFGKQFLHILIDKAVMRQRAAASLLGA